MKDFWLSCGHHLLDRDAHGRLHVTDEFLKIYLARPELTPPRHACVMEHSLHKALLSDPWRPVSAAQIAAIADADARENWQLMIALRDHLAAHRTLEATYLALVRDTVEVAPLFLDHLVQLILRSALDQCEDVYMLRAAELFFRPQRLAVHQGALLAADKEQVDANGPWGSPLAVMFGLPETRDLEVLGDDNLASYWDRADRFDLALDLTAAGRGLAALGSVIVRWVRHMLDIDVIVEPVAELREVALAWYVGLDVHGTKIGDRLWNGEAIDEATRSRLVGLFRLTFADPARVIERLAGETVYLILAMAPDHTLRVKPQNLLTGLPLAAVEAVS